MILDICILAHNEETDIEETLRQVSSQAFSTETQLHKTYIIVNGSSDRTAQIAQSFEGLPLEVHELDLGDKANAWNHYTHHLRQGVVAATIFMDVGILLRDGNVFNDLVIDYLERQDGERRVYVCTSLPKPIASFATQKAIQRTLPKDGKLCGTICGQLYLADKEFMDRVIIPMGAPGEDGYLALASRTLFFTEPERLWQNISNRVAGHSFYSERSLLGIYKHETRMILGTFLNHCIFRPHFHREVTQQNKSLVEIVNELNLSYPHWIQSRELFRSLNRHRWIPLSLTRKFIRKRCNFRINSLSNLKHLILIWGLAILAHIRANLVLTFKNPLKYW